MNYGLTIYPDGVFQIIDTALFPGIKDDFSQETGRTYVFYVAPKNEIDRMIGLVDLGFFYFEIRRLQDPIKIRDAILNYFGKSIQKIEIDYEETEETEWEPRLEYHIKK